MVRTIAMWAVTVLASLGLALAQMGSPQSQPPSGNPGGNPSSTGPNSGMSPMGTPSTMGYPTSMPRADDKRFLQETAMAELTEVEVSKLATQKASTEGVRQLAQKLTAENEQANQELRKLAETKAVQVADGLDSKHKARVDKLAKLEGTAFDKAYVKEISHETRDDATEFQSEAQGGTDPEVKSFATRVLPMVQAENKAAKHVGDEGKESSPPTGK